MIQITGVAFTHYVCTRPLNMTWNGSVEMASNVHLVVWWTATGLRRHGSTRSIERCTLVQPKERLEVGVHRSKHGSWWSGHGLAVEDMTLRYTQPVPNGTNQTGHTCSLKVTGVGCTCFVYNRMYIGSQPDTSTHMHACLT